MVKGAVDYAKMNEEAEIEEFLKLKKGLFNKFWNRLSRTLYAFQSHDRIAVATLQSLDKFCHVFFKCLRATLPNHRVRAGTRSEKWTLDISSMIC